jgi:hypothetical protein
MITGGSLENKCLDATKKLANSGQGEEFQMDTAPSNQTLRVNSVAVVSLEKRHHLFTHAIFPTEGSRRNGVQATSDMPANETTLEGPTSKPAVIRNLYRNRQAKIPSSLDKSAASGDSSAEENTRDDAAHAKVPCLAHQRKTINSFSHARLVAGPPEHFFSVAAKKLANSRQGAESQPESQPETALSNEMPNSVAPAEPLQQRHNNLLGDGSSTNSVHATPDTPASIPQDMMQQTPRDEVFQSDNVLREELV